MQLLASHHQSPKFQISGLLVVGSLAQFTLRYHQYLTLLEGVRYDSLNLYVWWYFLFDWQFWDTRMITAVPRHILTIPFF